MTGTLRVLLADDQALVLAGFGALLEAEEGIEVAGTAGNGEEAVALARALVPDVVLMDVRMPRMDGLEATRRIVTLPEPPRVVVLTTFDLDEYVVTAIAAGASGFLLKDAPPEEMLTAVRTVHAGDAVIAASSTRRLLQHVGPMLRAGAATPAAGAQTLPTDLTPRELEVLECMAHGLTNGEIAQRFFVSEATVKTHVGRVLAKTRSRDRVQAVVLAFSAGLVQPGDVLRDAR